MQGRDRLDPGSGAGVTGTWRPKWLSGLRALAGGREYRFTLCCLWYVSGSGI